jgi:hypothetical protein
MAFDARSCRFDIARYIFLNGWRLKAAIAGSAETARRLVTTGQWIVQIEIG